MGIRKLFGVLEIVVDCGGTKVYIVNIFQAVPLQRMYFIMCKVYVNEKSFFFLVFITLVLYFRIIC